ncbi:MAG: class I SAM-dependent methyltransferase [Leptospiraceae bacterium]|nr:class I SAM-dependent methyltransferase [Leptospiraceae bacterium]
MLRKIAYTLKKGTEELNYGRPIIAGWAAKALLDNASGANVVHLLDPGCGHGTDLQNSAKAYQELIHKEGILAAPALQLHGIENYPPYVKDCEEQGIEVASVDIEKDIWPFPDASMDVIICNQVLEHTKELFWIFSQFARILKTDGRLILGTPNLASFHNRMLLLFGQHPTAQQSFSAHVRSFTLPDQRTFAEKGGFFTFEKRAGSNFYPFPPFISKPLAKIFPGMAWGLFTCFRRTDNRSDYLDYLSDELGQLETPFYGSPQNPAKKTRPVATTRKPGSRPGAKKKSAAARKGTARGRARR